MMIDRRVLLTFVLSTAMVGTRSFAQDDYSTAVEEPPPPEEAPPPEEPVEEVTEPPPVEPIEERDPPPEVEEPRDPQGGDGYGMPQPDPNYGSSSGATEVPTELSPEEEKKRKRKIIRTVERKTFTSQQIREACNKHGGKLIAFYGDVFMVDKCERRRITDSKTIYHFLQQGKSVTDVDQDTIAMIPEGKAYDLILDEQKPRPCAEFDHQYVTYSNVDVYYVENCKKRIFPDWETYLEHRKKNKKTKGNEIIALSLTEFSRLAKGNPMSSVIDEGYAKLLDGSAGVDVIPIDEACRGLNGKIASYYDKLYRVENCRKREILDPSWFFKKRGGEVKFEQLSSEQWLSLPDGKPIDNQRDDDSTAAN